MKWLSREKFSNVVLSSLVNWKHFYSESKTTVQSTFHWSKWIAENSLLCGHLCHLGWAQVITWGPNAKGSFVWGDLIFTNEMSSLSERERRERGGRWKENKRHIFPPLPACFEEDNIEPDKGITIISVKEHLYMFASPYFPNLHNTPYMHFPEAHSQSKLKIFVTQHKRSSLNLLTVMHWELIFFNATYTILDQAFASIPCSFWECVDHSSISNNISF